MPEPSMRMLHMSTPEEAAAVVAAVLMFRESSDSYAPGALARAPASGRTG